MTMGGVDSMKLGHPNKILALSLGSIVLGMTLLAFASAPIYSLFCKVTGYGGTTQKIITVSNQVGKKKLKVIFDANVEPSLKWKFIPEQKSVDLMTGENVVIFYSAANLESIPVVGTAVYNVTPHAAGKYFNKIQCFCFEEQTLEANSSMLMPVSFFIDTAIEEDSELEGLSEITLSYTFFRTK